MRKYHDCNEKPNGYLVYKVNKDITFPKEDRVWQLRLSNTVESKCIINYCPFCGKKLD